MEDSSPAVLTSLLSDSWNDSTTADMSTDTDEDDQLKRLLSYIRIYVSKICPVFIVLFGTYGNLMILIIIRRMKSNESSFNIYFISIAVLDLVILYTRVVVTWLSYFDIWIQEYNEVICKILSWLSTGGPTISGWYLVSMSVHRAMSVVWPHRVNVLCTRRVVLLAITGISVFFAALYSHSFIVIELKYFPSHDIWLCVLSQDDNHVYVTNIFVYIELSVYSFLPFAAIAVSNSVLVWKLAVSVKAAGRHLSHGDAEQVRAREKAAYSVTLTVIVVSTTFLVLTLPVSINFILYYFSIAYTTDKDSEYAKQYLIYTICEHLASANNAVNFYLYCLTGRRFREEFINVMCCGRNTQPQSASK